MKLVKPLARTGWLLEAVSRLRIEKKSCHTSRSQAPPGNQENHSFHSTILAFLGFLRQPLRAGRIGL